MNRAKQQGLDKELSERDRHTGWQTRNIKWTGKQTNTKIKDNYSQTDKEKKY